MARKKRSRSSSSTSCGVSTPTVYDPTAPVTQSQLSWITKNQSFEAVDSTIRDLESWIRQLQGTVDELKLKVNSVRYL